MFLFTAPHGVRGYDFTMSVTGRLSIFAALIANSAVAQPTSGFLTLVPVVPSGLSNPVAIVNAGDGSGRLFIVEQTGKIRVLENGSLVADPFIDLGQSGLGLSTSCTTGGCGEQGLLGLAFHPNYISNGHFFVYYTRQAAGGSNGDIVIRRYTVSADDNVADTTTGQTVLVIDHPAATNHNGGTIAFRPEDNAAYLYAGTGDGGSTPQNGQSLTSLLGKILRLDVDGDAFPADPQLNYAIPPTNPFVGVAGADEIWDYGLRNPYRWSFDSELGGLYIGDVGQNAWEEIDFDDMTAGGINYGWDRCEGFHDYTGTNSPDCAGIVSALPILEFDHSVPPCASVTGGFVYRGSDSASISGKYIYADFCTGRFWSGTKTGPSTWTSQPLFDNTLSPAGFGEDEQHKLYFAHHGGAVYRIAPYSFPEIEPDDSRWSDIETLYLAGVTLGCAGGRYCPDGGIQRQQAAALLVRARDPNEAAPTECTPPYGDVTGGPYCPWIEVLKDRDITAGCGGGNFCPTGVLTRAVLARFLVRSEDWPAATTLDTCSGSPPFTDVPASHPLCDWIKTAENRGAARRMRQQHPLLSGRSGPPRSARGDLGEGALARTSDALTDCPRASAPPPSARGPSTARARRSAAGSATADRRS